MEDNIKDQDVMKELDVDVSKLDDPNLIKMVKLYNMLSWYFCSTPRPKPPKNTIKTDTLIEELVKMYRKEKDKQGEK